MDAFSVVLALAWLLGGYVGGKIARFVMTRWLRKLAERTKTELDDEIIRALENPVYYVFLLVGVYFAAITLVLADWRTYVDVGIKVVGVLIVGKAIKNILADVLFVHYVNRLPGGRDTKERLLSIKGMLDTVLYLIIVLIALSAMGVDVWPVLTPLGVSGVAIAFAVKDVASNYVAGLILVAEKEFKKGMRVMVKEKGIEGVVVGVGWRSVHIRTDDGKDVFISNSTVLNSTIIMLGKQAKK